MQIAEWFTQSDEAQLHVLHVGLLKPETPMKCAADALHRAFDRTPVGDLVRDVDTNGDSFIEWGETLELDEAHFPEDWMHCVVEFKALEEQASRVGEVIFRALVEAGIADPYANCWYPDSGKHAAFAVTDFWDWSINR
jgi:hypothetical protein